MSWSNPIMTLLIICLLLCNQVYTVVAATASECSVAIVAAVFGTIAAMLLIAAIAAFIWYCWRKRRSGSTGSASVETASEPEIEFGSKTERNGFDMGLDGQPVTFSHHYSEIAPSAAYNTSGVVNPAFAGSQEVLLDIPAARKGIENPAFPGNREVKVDIPEFGKDEVAIDVDGDPSLRADLPDGKLRTGFPSGSIEGLDADVKVEDPPVPKVDLSGPNDMQTVDVTLDRPESGGFGLLIARDKTLPPPALFVREVTQGGVAEKTGLIHGGDKIIAINGVSVEGMPHGKAMELLRGSKSPKLNLKLLKLGGNINAEAPCTVNMENELEAAIPKAGFEGGIDIPSNQGNLDVPRPSVSMPDGKMSVNGSELDIDGGNWDVSARAPRPGVAIETPEMQGPRGNLRANVSGPDRGLPTDRPRGPKANTGAPSVELDLPSKKKTRGKCLSCASSPEKNEPYGRAKAGGKGQYNFNAPDVDQSFEMKRFGEVNTPGPDLNVEGTDRKVELRTSRPDIDIATGNRDIRDASVSVPPVSQEGDFALFSVKKDVDFDSSGPNADVSFKKPQAGIKTPQGNVGGQISGPTVDLSGPEMRGPKANTNLPTMPAAGKPKGEPDVNYGMKLSGPDADISGLKVRDPKARVSGPSAEADVPQPKKKGAKCLSCTGGSDKDEPYGKTGGKAEFDFERPQVDGAFDVNKPGIRGSRPSVDGPKVREFEKDISLSTTGPVRNIHKQTPFEDIEISGPGVFLPSTDKRGDSDFGASVPDVDIPKRKPGTELRTKHPDTDMPGRSSVANISGPEADLSAPRVRSPDSNVNASSADMSLPSTKKKSASCLSCAKSGDRDEPYGKAKARGNFDFDRPEVDESMKMKKRGTFDVRGSTPDIDGRLGNRDVSVNVAGPSQDADISANGGHLDFGGSGPNVDISATKPRVQFDTTSPDTRLPKEAVPKANIATTKADVAVPSSEKKRGNCLSCTPSSEKDEPYWKRGGGADFRFDKPAIDGSMDLKMDRNVNVDGSVPDIGGFKGKGINKEVKLHTATPDIDIPKGNLDGNIDLPGPNVSKPSTSGVGKMSIPPVDGEDVDLDLSRTNVEIASKRPRVGLDTNSLGTEFSKGKFDGNVSGPDFDGFDPNLSSSGRDLDIRKGSLDLDIEHSRPNVSIPSVNGGNLDFDASVPNEDISGNKPQVDLDTNSLDLGKRKDSFDLNGSSELDLDDFWKKDRLDLPSTGLDIDIPNGNLDKDIDLSGDVSIPSTVQEENFSMPSVSDGGFDGPSADVSMRKPGVDLNDRLPSGGLKLVPNGLGGSGINEDYEIPKEDLDTDLDISGLRASLPSSRQEGKLSVPLAEQEDVDLTGPSVDVSKTKPRIGVDLDGPTIDFEWGGKTSTPKKHFSGKPRFDLTNVHGDNEYDNIELASPPEGLRNDATNVSPKIYEEPRDLSRYDEIRPEMNLKLYSPEPTGSINGVPEPQSSTPSVTLVKVEENVSVYSASLQKEPASPSKSMMFVLDRKVHQKLEIVVPDEVDRGGSLSSTLKKSSSNSSSSSSDDERDTKRKSKQKRRFRLPKLNRKGSTSSKSSQEEDGAKSLDSPVTKAKRKSSASSSSSDDDSVAKPMQRGGTTETHPPPSKLDIPLSTSAKKEKEDTSSSSSSDEVASVIHKANIPKRKSSKSTSSSSEDEDSRNRKSPEDTPNEQDFSLRGKFETPKPVPEVILAKQKDKQERQESTNSSSSSDEDVIEKKDLSSTTFAQKMEYDVHPHPLTVASDEPSAVHADLPEVVFHSTKPANPDFSFMSSEDLPSGERKSSTSSTSSSDEETTAPTEDHGREDKGEPVPLATPVEEEAPEPVSRHREPADLNFSFMLQTSEMPVKETTEPKLRKSSTSSSSSSDDEVRSGKPQLKFQERKSSTSSFSSDEEKTSLNSLTLDVKRHEYETVYHVITPDYPTTGPETDNSGVQELAPVVVTRSIKRTTPDFSDEENEDLHTHLHIKDVTEDTHYQIEYPYNVTRTHDIDSTIKDQEEPVTAMVSPLVKSEIPDYSVRLMQHDEPEVIDKGDEDHKLDLLLSDIDGRQSPSLDVQVHRYETVYHVIRYEYPSVSQKAEGSEVREDSPIVVSRSLQRLNLDVEQTGSPGEDELHDTPHFVSSVQHVSYSEPSLDYKATGHNLMEGHNWEEEWITASERSVEEFTPNIDLWLAFSEEPGDMDKSGENATKEQEPSKTSRPDRGNEKSANIKRPGSSSRIWDLMQEYLIEEPILDDDSELKTTEGVPETSKQDDDQLKATERHIDRLESLPNSEREVSGSLQTEQVTLTVFSQTVHDANNGPQAPVLEPEFKDQMAEFKEVSVNIETRPKVTDDHPVIKDEPPAPELNEIQLETIPKSEDDVSHGLRSEPETFTIHPKTVQATKESPQTLVSGPQFQEVALTIESRTKVEGAQPVIEEGKPEFDKPKKPKPKVKESLLESVPKAEGDVSADTQLQKVYVTQKTTYVSSSGPQYKEVAFTIEPKKAVLDDKPDVKEASLPSWKRRSRPSAEDVDSPEDPWMRHYSQGLERGYNYQPTYRRTSFGRSPETDTSLSQSRSISLSKVPHVRELKVTGERGRERPKYLVQTRTHPQSLSLRAPGDGRGFVGEWNVLPGNTTGDTALPLSDAPHQQVTGRNVRERGSSPVRRGQSSETRPLSELLSVWERETSPRARQRNTYR